MVAMSLPLKSWPVSLMRSVALFVSFIGLSDARISSYKGDATMMHWISSSEMTSGMYRSSSIDSKCASTHPNLAISSQDFFNFLTILSTPFCYPMGPLLLSFNWISPIKTPSSVLSVVVILLLAQQGKSTFNFFFQVHNKWYIFRPLSSP